MSHAIKSALSLVFVMALAASPAIAKDHGRGHDRDQGRHGYSDRNYRSDRDHGRNESHRRDRDRRYSYDRDDRYYRSAPPRVVVRQVYRPAYQPGYGYGQPRWARGARYYGDGYGPTYVVNDYRGYGLRAPPRGHYWRRSDAGDYLLVAIATGIITDLILRH